ncbi:glycoside hydrolase family 99-like domain-containing protein [Ravibacter arvi]|uniref:Glycoside hydrolase family 99-like domain-containing protein n=1 Tax=Ravibacter arvi TaxID=2051041 RepID=A0ABP8M252_9BACT
MKWFSYILASFIIISISPANSQKSSAARPEVAVVYYPHWHTYKHGNAWKGENWTEWQEMADAIPRFPGHEQPKVSSWGPFDESDPGWVEKEIDLAADHGIDVFLYDWYWYSGVKNMEEALENGFLKAKNRSRMKFALMWANHDRRDQFYPEYGVPRNIWLYSRHTEKDLIDVVNYGIKTYFKEPIYWRVNGELFFSIFETKKFIDQLGGPARTKEIFENIDRLLAEHGLPKMHWSGMVPNTEVAQMAEKAGFKSTSKYNISSSNKMSPDLTVNYSDLIDEHTSFWKSITADTRLPHMPVVTMGWDPTPRCRLDVPWPFKKIEYPYTQVVIGNTPEKFRELLGKSKRQVETDKSKHLNAILINAWNEWTEGAYLLPEKRTGTQYLEAIKNVYGLAPATRQK